MGKYVHYEMIKRVNTRSLQYSYVDLKRVMNREGGIVKDVADENIPVLIRRQLCNVYMPVPRGKDPKFARALVHSAKKLLGRNVRAKFKGIVNSKEVIQNAMAD